MAINRVKRRGRYVTAGLAAGLVLTVYSPFAPGQVKRKPAVKKTVAVTPSNPGTKYILSRLTKEDMKILLDGASPAMLRQLAGDPELKKKQARAVREMLAIASEGIKKGIVDAAVAAELENIRIETAAQIYDQKVNPDKQAGPFSAVSDTSVTAFYAKPGSQAKFEKFLKGKIDQAKKTGTLAEDYTPSEEEIKQVRDMFAREQIRYGESKLKAAKLGPAYARTTELRIRLQQTQYISRLYAKTVADKAAVTEEEVTTYIDKHPELYMGQKAKARKILDRARAGEDFAALANEFSEDPGNKGDDGKSKGGLYKDVPRGMMVKPFEQAALALEPGQISADLVESDFGYHIIKLERKSDTYDVRHILFSTMIADPDNPQGRPQPLRDAVRNRLETARQDAIMDEILKNNPVIVANDFDVPAVAEKGPPEAK